MTASRYLGGLKIFDFLEMQELLLGREMQFQYRRIHFRYRKSRVAQEPNGQVWVTDSTNPQMIYVASEAIAETTIQVIHTS